MSMEAKDFIQVTLDEVTSCLKGTNEIDDVKFYGNRTLKTWQNQLIRALSLAMRVDDVIVLCQQGFAEARKQKLVWFEHIFERIEAAVLAQQQAK